MLRAEGSKAAESTLPTKVNNRWSGSEQGRRRTTDCHVNPSCRNAQTILPLILASSATVDGIPKGRKVDQNRSSGRGVFDCVSASGEVVSGGVEGRQVSGGWYED